MLLAELHHHATNIQSPSDSITFAMLVCATVEADVTGNTAKDIYARKVLANSRHILQLKIENLEE